MAITQCTVDNFIYLLFFTNWVFVERTNGQYEFELEEIEYTYPTFVNEIHPVIMAQSITEYPLNRLSLAEHRTLCGQASEHAVVDQIDPQKIGVEVGVNLFGVRYPNGSDTWWIALICATIPRIYLRLVKNTTNKITIMIPRNQYMDPQYGFQLEIVGYIKRLGDFDTEIVDSTKEMVKTGASNLEALGNLPYLVYRSNIERRKICLAARKRIQFPRITIISEEWTEKAEKYEIEYFDIKIIVAFPCNSDPKMYLRMLDDSKTKFVIMFSPW